MAEEETKNRNGEVRLVPLFHTILATQNKTSELFVKSFQYQGENIATKHLGQIFGFFEIPDTHEDNAYIVNFLASVVKKEYFVNPKRSVSDSFETALHKINLALTELVKQGNTEWLGKIHGAVCVIENNNFHFSVTGDAAILLYRDNLVTCISEGLADKDAALHPLKTFLEISSGAILPGDKLLLSSPELFTLCDSEVLRKNAFRMDKNGFARFVRAALINELPLGVSMIIDITEEKVVASPKRKAKALREESLEKLQNVFSGSSFQHDEALSEPEEAPVALSEPEEEQPIEYTDQKTGHIYVQGETHNISFQEPSGWQMFLEEHLRPFWKNFLVSWRRITKKSRKVVKKQASVIGVETKELSTTFWKASKETGKKLIQKSSTVFQKNPSQSKSPTLQEPVSFDSLPELPEIEPPFSEPAQEAISEIPSTEETAPLSPRQKALQRFSQSYQPPEKSADPFKTPSNALSAKKIFSDFLRAIPLLFNTLLAQFKNFAPKQKVLIGIGVLVVIIGGVFLLGKENENPQEAAEPMNTQSQSDDTQSITTPQTLGEANTVTTWTEGQALLVVRTDTTTVVVTPKTVIIDGNSIPFPADGTVTAATYMTDLRMIFMWSDKRELASWSVVDRKFSANTFPLPANTTVSALGSYLTYLYALDNTQGTIYRFARTEGGFTEGSSWLKAPFAKESVKALVVTDTIRIAGSALDQYLRGNKEKTLSETSYDILGLSGNRNFTIAIETESGKMSIWNTDGAAVYEGTFEELKGISAVTYDENNKKLLVSKDQSLLEYSLSW